MQKALGSHQKHGFKKKYFQPARDFQLVRAVIFCHLCTLCLVGSGPISGHLCTHLHVAKQHVHCSLAPGLKAELVAEGYLLHSVEWCSQLQAQLTCVQVWPLLWLVISLKLCLHDTEKLMEMEKINPTQKDCYFSALCQITGLTELFKV